MSFRVDTLNGKNKSGLGNVHLLVKSKKNNINTRNDRPMIGES